MCCLAVGWENALLHATLEAFFAIRNQRTFNGPNANTFPLTTGIGGAAEGTLARVSLGELGCECSILDWRRKVMSNQGSGQQGGTGIFRGSLDSFAARDG